VHFINDVDFVFSFLRGVAHLLYEVTDVVYRVIGSRIEFVYVEGSVVLKGNAGIAGAAGFKVFGDGFAVDGFGEDTGAGSLSYTSGSTKKKCLGKVLVFDCILKGGRDVLLPHDTLKICRSIFSCRNNEIFHPRKI
jgi:hypothetical protein